MAEPTARPGRLRIGVIGAHRQRVTKVVSLLESKEPWTLLECQKEGGRPTVIAHYLPCVAHFDSYETDQGDSVRYLASLQYYGPSDKNGSSLAPFFDQVDDEEKDATGNVFQGIAAFAVGCGIETEQDVSLIRNFVQAFSNAGNEPQEKEEMVVECVAPNPQFSTMAAENAAYKALEATDKEEVTRLHTMGPGKMAKFAVSLAQRVLERAFSPPKAAATDEEAATSNALSPATTIRPVIDPTQPAHACRICRSILFGEADLEDPPHVPSQHHFSQRKLHHAGGAAASTCESYFLARELDWMGPMSAPEGKFNCPKCKSKLGSWKWSGAQCSCGTWVAPAIQIHRGKVDLVLPFQEGPPAGTVTSPFALVSPSHSKDT